MADDRDVDASAPIPLPAAVEAAIAHDAVEIGVAIDLVASGVSRRITLVGLHHPEEAAARSTGLAGAAGVRLVRDHHPGAPMAVILEADRP